ncbi:MAG TPA: alpha/beta hydrolase [Micropepsaceae bacterium]|nr:alpha/beta hydrolase [Micropepsaceae bacterium]
MNLLAAVTKVFGLLGEGRSPAMLLNLGVPQTGYRVERDIVYGPHRRHRMDLYLPQAGKLERDAPAVLFFYGGAFRAGCKSEYRFVGEALTGAGISVAIPDYRIYPAARFPNFLQDGALAVAKLLELDFAPGGLFLMGHSAGAYIAAMLGANDSYLRACGVRASSIGGVIALSGRYHDSPLQDATAEEIFCGPARRETRPAAFLGAHAPPYFLAAGGRESSTVLASKAELAARLRRTGNHVEEHIYTGLGHAGIIAALTPRRRTHEQVLSDIVGFVRQHSRSRTELLPQTSRSDTRAFGH